jgi:chromosome segregation ATPase
MQQNVDTLSSTLQSLESRKAAVLAELQPLESKRKTLTDALQPLIVEVETLTNKRNELRNEIESLSIQVQQSEAARKSEEASINLLRRERLELEREVKREVRKNSRHNGATGKKKPRRISQETHTFIGKYEGKEDWNKELARRIQQFELSLDHTSYSASPEKITFSVTGPRENIEKLSTALNGLEGFVNLRSQLAETKRNLRASINARNAKKEQLDTLNEAPWYKRRTTRNLKRQKAELSQELTAEDMKISALTENLKALENVLGPNEHSKGP